MTEGMNYNRYLLFAQESPAVNLFCLYVRRCFAYLQNAIIINAYSLFLFFSSIFMFCFFNMVNQWFISKVFLETETKDKT